MPIGSQRPILIDTCMWVEFFNHPQSRTKTIVDLIVRARRALIIGPILTEVLQGCRRDAEANWVWSLLRGSCEYINPSINDWRAAGDLGRLLASLGRALPLPDLIIAAIATRLDVAVYTTDPHFEVIPHLTRYQPDA